MSRTSPEEHIYNVLNSIAAIGGRVTPVGFAVDPEQVSKFVFPAAYYSSEGSDLRVTYSSVQRIGRLFGVVVAERDYIKIVDLVDTVIDVLSSDDRISFESGPVDSFDPVLSAYNRSISVYVKV